MSHSSNESEDGLHYTDQSGSLLVDEVNDTNAAGVALKKGPWTSAEDAILVDYVKKHGEGNWNAVQKHSGLSRCGKSCRLRWANHLRPNLKKGAFTAEEEQLIIELHAKMGNKWARMAAHLPGRTDNEIKNYWNTRIKRRQRAGLPLYPPEVCLQALQAHREGQETGGLDNGDNEDYDMWKASYEYIPDAIFDRYTVNQEVLPYASELLKIPPCNMMIKGYASPQYCSLLAPTFHRQKRLRESTPLIPASDECIKRSADQFMDRSCDKIAQSFGSYFSFDPDPDPAPAPAPKSTISLDVIQGDHSLSNGNSSASQSHIGNEKLELPSLQFAKTDLGSWETSSLPHISESVDAFIQFPSSNSMIGSDCLSQCNSGLLDALLHDANCAYIVKDHLSGCNSSTLSPGNILHGSNLNFCEAEWKDYAEPPTPFGHSCAPLLTECTPISSSGSSYEEIPPAEPLSEFHNSGNHSTRSLVKTEPDDQGWSLEREKDVKTGLSFTRSDAFLAPEWLEQNSGFVNDLGMLVGDDLAADYKNMADGNSTSSSGWGLGSSWAWHNMTAACQMTDLLPQ